MPRHTRLAGSSLATLLMSISLALVLCSTAGAISVSELDVLVFGQGTVHLSPPSEGIDECSSTCELAYPDGTGVTLTAVTSGEWTFNDWGTCDEEPGPTECVVYTTEFEKRRAEASFVNPPPALPAITLPAENQQIETTGPPVEVEVAFEDGDPTVTGYECDLDAAGPPQPCTSPWVIPSVAVGAHTAYVFALDAEGNGSEVPAARHFSVVVPNSGEPGTGSPATKPGPLRTTSSEPLPGTRTSRRVKLHARWKVTRRGAGVRNLLLDRLPGGASVGVTCSGSDCPFRSRKAKVRGHRANLTGFFGDHTLLAGDVVRLRVDSEGGTQTIKIEIRSGKAPKIIGL